MGVTHEGPHQPYWQSGVIQRCERRFGGERGRGRVTQREREKERIDYADMYIPLVRCVYDSLPYKSIIPLMHWASKFANYVL